MLAKQLASHFSTDFVPEIARDFIENLGRAYNFNDLVVIAKKQLSTENLMAEKASDILFCDTDILVTKVWSNYKYNRCDPWIEENVINHRYDLYLLCDIDLPWEDDPLREHPDERKELFEIYRSELEAIKANYRIITGTGEARLETAILAVKESFGRTVGL